MHNIIIFGASITQGAFDDVGAGWANRLAAHYFKTKGVVMVFNLGISGDTSAGVRKRLEVELAPRLEDADKITIVISVGGNDALVDVDTGAHLVELNDYLDNMNHCIQFCKQRGYDVACVGLGSIDESKLNPLPWDPSSALRKSDIVLYDEALKKLCDTEGATYVPMRDLFPDLTYLVDGDHPNAEGHRLMFERVKKYLEKISIL